MKHLVILAKAPRRGQVKTRLAAGVGVDRALAFYRASVDGMLRGPGSDRRWRTVLAVAPDTAAVRPGPWTRGVAVQPQGGGGLGARMARPFAVLPRGPVVLVGGDIPGLGPAQIAAAFRALAGHDFVFGPATDGGFWLVGAKGAARRRLPALFAGARWSTPHALADVLVGLRPGERVALLAPLSDVDDAAAYVALQAAPPRTQKRAQWGWLSRTGRNARARVPPSSKAGS